MDRVCGCVDLTDSNVISDPMTVKMTEIAPGFSRCAAHLNWRNKIITFDL